MRPRVIRLFLGFVTCSDLPSAGRFRKAGDAKEKDLRGCLRWARSRAFLWIVVSAYFRPPSNANTPILACQLNLHTGVLVVESFMRLQVCLLGLPSRVRDPGHQSTLEYRRPELVLRLPFTWTRLPLLVLLASCFQINLQGHLQAW